MQTPSRIFGCFLLFSGLVVHAQMPDVMPSRTPIAAPSPPAPPAPPVFASPTPEAVATPPPPASHSIFLDVRDLGTNLSSSQNWHSVWGSYSKNTTRARALELTLRNPAKLPGDFRVEYFFFATPARGGKRFLFDQDSKVFSLPPGGTEKATIVSDEVESHSVHYADDYYYSASMKTGTKPEGWIVAAYSDEKLIRIKTSSGQLDDLYKTADDFKALSGTKRKNKKR